MVIMERNIFGLQCEFIERWDNKFREKCLGEPKKERLHFFRILNMELADFYVNYIDYNIWQLQRAYLFAFWIGTLYLQNPDCISEIEKILNFSSLFYPFKRIVTMLNKKVRRVIIDADSIESKIIFDKMNEFKNDYNIFEINVNKIIKFFRICQRKKMLVNYCVSIAVLRRRMPDELVLSITNYFYSDNDYKIKYLQNKKDIDFIIENCGLNNRKLVIEKYYKNKQCVETTIDEILQI